MNDTISLVWNEVAYTCATVTEGESLLPELPSVIAYSQNDARWAQMNYAPNFTFARYGCLVTCIAMVAATHLQEDHNPMITAAKLRNANAFAGGLLSRPAQIPVAIPALTWHGVLHWRTIPADIAQLADMIAQHGPTIIEVKWDSKGGPVTKGNQHFVLATNVANDNVEIIDAWDGKPYWITETPYARPSNWTAARAIHGIRMIWPEAN